MSGGERSLRGVAGQRRLGLPALDFVQGSLIALVVIVGASWLTILSSPRLGATGFFSSETFRRTGAFLEELAGIGSDATPAYLRWEEWTEKAGLAVDTLAMSVIGVGIAGSIALALFMFGARNVMLGELAPYGSAALKALFMATRAFFTLTRSIPELVWAMIVVFAFTPGILPGAIALGVHNAGVLGRLGSEVVEGLDPRPLRALRSAGASRFQVLLFGVLPMALPRFLSYLFYRWEVIIRTTVVVGFVAAGGLGAEFRLAMSHFKYTEVALVLVWYLLIVVAVDAASAYMRRLAAD